MNPTSSMQGLETFDPKQRVEFYENLIAMLAAEVEVCYPDGVSPGKEYDKAVRKVRSLIKVKGQIHAFYKLNLRGDLVIGRWSESADLVKPGDVDFLLKLVEELDGETDVQRRVTDIIGNVLGRVSGGTKGNDLSPSWHRSK